MDKTLTVSVRNLVTTVVAAVAMLAAYVLGTANAGQSVAAAVAPTEADNTIVMTGTGEAVGTPDQLAFNLGVRTQAADVSTALQQANAVTRKVVKAVRGHEVAFKDIQTTGLSIHPTFDYSSSGPAVITGYAVGQTVAILQRDLRDAGATISAAVDAGGNAVRLSNVRLQVGDDEALLSEARKAAIAEAHDKAEQYASAAGTVLGTVSSVREVSAPAPMVQSYRTASLDSAEPSSVPIRPGRSETSVTVSVVWSLG
jgi:uncharacterized protein YggE